MDDWTELSVDDYRARLHAAHAFERAKAHAWIDALFDELLADAEQQLHVIERDFEGTPAH